MQSWTWWLGLLAAIARARELDPAACASRFDVQREKIIRTEESREMGARYLSELDVGGRHECLRLCCETDTCDVFIYEEKSPGSCYLFNCGPPEDFRCKFTAHSNFSSGVLALSRSLAELQDQERLTHHEQELANLRTWTSTTAKTTTVTTPSPRQPPSPAPALATRHPQPTPRRCSRYQFECHTGGECIAVYNACDGIAQCADGSDEAPELGCPSAPPLETAAAQTTTTVPTPPVKPLQESSDRLAVGAAAGGDSLVPAESPMLGNDRWPHRLTQAQPQRKYTDPGPSSHIFSHKGGLLQEPDNAMPSMVGQYPAFEAPWPRRQWGQPAPGMDGVDRWGGALAPGGYQRYEWPEPDARRGWPVPQPRPEPEMPVYLPPKTMPETVNVYSNQHTLRDSPKKGQDLVQKTSEAATEPPILHRDPDSERPPVLETTTKKLKQEKTTATLPPPPASEKKPPAPAHAVKHEHFTAPDEHDGLSEHPPAAVMLLVLGILMTTVMGVMLGCRARAARRRLRRGKSPFAHDADYLVNGMYL